MHLKKEKLPQPSKINTMKTKTTLTILGSIFLIQGLGFFIGAEYITKDAFKGFGELSRTALEVGTILHQAMASIIFGLGILTIACRTISGKHAVNFLQGMIALNTTVLAVALYSSATTKAQAPIPVVVLFVVFLVLLFLSMRTENAQA
mgnify:CR=1 FL=1